MIIETFRQAIQNVWSNKLRTFLTMLGIIIGVMAVIVIVGLGNGMTKSMRDSFSALGTNTLSVQVWGNGSRTVSVEEMYKLPTEYPEPYTTAMRLSSQSTVNNYAAVMEDEGRANEAKSAVESELQRLLGSDNGYYVYSASEWLEEMNNMINMVIVILTGIASISLLVGGIGIMNIMLVSVTERTREIGIRKALGAKERTILSQFVVEAATTSALGGALGIALGYIVSMGANKVLPMFTSGTTVTVSPSFNSIAVAFGISVGIGVLFGYLPAKRAARLNPIEALRYD